MTLNYYEIGQRIRKYRKACGLTQEELAERINISATHMSHIETGSTKLGLPVFIKISKALSVQADLLLSDITGNSDALDNHLIDILEGCTSKELLILTEVVTSTLSAIRKYK